MAVMSKPTLLTMPAEVRLRIYDCVLEPLVIRTMPEYYYMFADEWRGLMLRDYHSLVVSCKLINGEVQQHFEQYYLPNTTLFFDDVVKFGRFVVAALSSPHADLLWDVSLSLRVWGCPNLRVESDVRNLAKDLSSIAASDGIHDFYRIAIKGKEKLIGVSWTEGDQGSEYHEQSIITSHTGGGHGKPQAL